MAQAQFEPSGSEVSKVESDIAQTITLADTIVTLIREPISLIYQNVTKTKELKRSLGVWQEEALEDGNWCRIPVLRLKELEKYLVDLDGVIPAASEAHSKRNSRGNRRFSLPWISWQRLSPSPSPAPKHEMPSAGTACWAYFLFALGIHPGKDMIGWRPSTDGFISTQNGGIEMEIEGSALCHIINLYAVSISSGGVWRSRTLPDRRKDQNCDFPFGKLAWNMVNDQVHAHFTPGLESELAAVKHPFEENEDHANPNTLMVSYLTSLYHGTSHSKYRLAPANASLSERIQKLVTCFKRLKARRKDLLLISYDWLEEASRVKRRVLAEGGENRSFFEDICSCCHKHFGGSDVWGDSRMRKLFLFGTETFRFVVPGGRLASDNSTNPRLEDLYWIIEETLASYETQPEGSWKRSLFERRKDILEVAKIPNDVELHSFSNIRLIEFTTSCDLWQQTVLLGAPTSAQ